MYRQNIFKEKRKKVANKIKLVSLKKSYSFPESAKKR